MPTPPTPGAEAEPRAGARASADRAPMAWVHDHLDAVYRYARRRLSAADAEEVAAEAFQALFEARARGTEPDDPAGYLFGVARRRVAERHRRRARGFEPLPLPAGWDAFCDRALPDEVASDRELAELVHVALGLVAFGTLPYVIVGCALFGLAMAGWMLPLGLLRAGTPASQVAWRTALYRVFVDGGLFMGPFLSGVLAARHGAVLPAALIALLLGLATAVVLLRRVRRAALA